MIEGNNKGNRLGSKKNKKTVKGKNR